MALRIGRVRYLHTEPFYFAMARRGMAFYELVPGAVTAARQTVAPTPGQCRWWTVGACKTALSRWREQVASVQRAGSSLLYSTRPITALAGAHIGVTDEAATALRLLHVLLRLKYQVQPAAFGPLQAAHDAFLLIGNQALRQRRGAPGFPYTYDLGAEWHAWTGLPFVFARWMVRKEVAAKDKALLEETLYVGLEDGVEALYQVAEPREDLLMLPRDIVMYIQGFRYYIGQSEQQAIDQFQRYLQQLEC
jgi:chorismate dehydratase